MTPRIAFAAMALALAAACGTDAQAPLELPPADTGDTAAPTDADHDAPDASDLDTDASNACNRREDCAHLDDCCFEGWCLSGTCQVRYKLDCCSVPGPCATYTHHHTATCQEACVVGGCVSRLDLPIEPCDEPVFTLTPSLDTLAQLTLTDSLPHDAVTWHLTSHRGLGGQPSFHAGHVTCPTYFSGPLDAACEPLPGAAATPVALTLTTPPIPLPTGGPLVAELWVWASFEPAPRVPGSHTPHDGLEIRVVAPSGYAETVWSSRASPLPSSTWTPILVDLTRWVGQTIAIRVAFDTLDAMDNHHEGMYLGGLRVTRVCEAQRTCPPPTPCLTGTMVPVAGVGDALCVLAPPDPAVPCQPCAQDADCAPADACDTVVCTEGRCVTKRTLTPACCTHDDVWPPPSGFEAPLDATWTAQPDASGALWHLSPLRAFEGHSALRFGLPDTPGLAPHDEAAEGVLWSPPITIPAESPVLNFALWLETEWEGTAPVDNPAGLDRLEVVARWEVLSTLAPAVLWTSDQIGGNTGGAWQMIAVPLTGLAGQPIRIGWRFATGDEVANEGEGVYVDAVTLGRDCPPCPPEAPCSDAPVEGGGGVAPGGVADPSRRPE